MNSDIEQRLGNATYVQLADDNGDGAADTAVVDEARLGAEGEINSYLAFRFQVPIDLSLHADLVGVLKSMTLDLVEFRLRCRRPPVPQDAIRKRDSAVEWLRGVVNGSIGLPAAAAVSANPTRGIVAVKTGSERLLTRKEFSGF